MTDVRNIHNNDTSLQQVSDIVEETNVTLTDTQPANDLQCEEVKQGSMLNTVKSEEHYNKLLNIMSLQEKNFQIAKRNTIRDNSKSVYQSTSLYPNLEEPFFVKQIRQNRISRQYFLNRVVDEYCGIYYLQNEFRVNVNDLSFEDKKLFLSHVVDAYDYEEYCSSIGALYAGFLDNLKYMQRLLDETSEEFYQEYLEKMGATTTLEHEYGISM